MSLNSLCLEWLQADNSTKSKLNWSEFSSYVLLIPWRYPILTDLIMFGCHHYFIYFGCIFPGLLPFGCNRGLSLEYILWLLSVSQNWWWTSTRRDEGNSSKFNAATLPPVSTHAAVSTLLRRLMLEFTLLLYCIFIVRKDVEIKKASSYWVSKVLWRYFIPSVQIKRER